MKKQINPLFIIVLGSCIAIMLFIFGVWYHFEQLKQKAFADADRRVQLLKLKYNIPADVQGQLIVSFIITQFAFKNHDDDLKYLTLPSNLTKVETTINDYFKINKSINPSLSPEKIIVTKTSDNTYKAAWLGSNEPVIATFKVVKGTDYDPKTQIKEYMTNPYGYYIIDIKFESSSQKT